MFGGVVENLESGDETHFGVEDIYTMSLWILLSHEGVFHRCRRRMRKRRTAERKRMCSRSSAENQVR